MRQENSPNQNRRFRETNRKIVRGVRVPFDKYIMTKAGPPPPPCRKHDTAARRLNARNHSVPTIGGVKISRPRSSGPNLWTCLTIRAKPNALARVHRVPKVRTKASPGDRNT